MKQKVLQVIYDAIFEVNIEHNLSIAQTPDTPLFGCDSGVDSLALVNLIVNVERRVKETLNETITIADERAMSQRHSPFRTVDALAEYIMELLS